MAEVAIVDPGRSFEAVPETGSPWILPEPWKTPGSPKIDGIVVLAFPTAPWTALRAAAQAPQAQRLPRTLEAKVMYDSTNWGR